MKIEIQKKENEDNIEEIKKLQQLEIKLLEQVQKQTMAQQRLQTEFEQITMRKTRVGFNTSM